MIQNNNNNNNNTNNIEAKLFPDYNFIYDNETGENKSFQSTKTKITVDFKNIHRMIMLKFIKLGMKFDKITLPWYDTYIEFTKNIKTTFNPLRREMLDTYNNISLNQDPKDNSINLYVSAPDLFDDGFFEWFQDNKKLFGFKRKFFETDFREVVENDYYYNNVDGTNYEKFCADFRNAISQELKSVMTNLFYPSVTQEELRSLVDEKIVCVNMRCRVRKNSVWELSEGFCDYCEKISEYSTLELINYSDEINMTANNKTNYLQKCTDIIANNLDRKMEDIINYCINNYGEGIVEYNNTIGDDNIILKAWDILNKYYKGSLWSDLTMLKNITKKLQKKFGKNLQGLLSMFITYEDIYNNDENENDDDYEDYENGYIKNNFNLNEIENVEDFKNFVYENFDNTEELTDKEIEEIGSFFKVTSKIKTMMNQMTEEEKNIIIKAFDDFNKEFGNEDE